MAARRPKPDKQAKELRESLQFLGKALQRSLKNTSSVPAVPDQPFDSLLLRWSSLYFRSRTFYLELGGTYTSTLVSSPRTLSSAILLENRIEYTPMQKEYLWAAFDPGQKHPGGDQHLLTLRSYVASVFHEQSHRILWQLLPLCPRDSEGLRRYLNFAESIVIATDMALADELGPDRALAAYTSGAIYNPGDLDPALKRLRKNRRAYRNYLQASAYATYLYLELYTPKQVEKALKLGFPQLQEWGEAVAHRTGQLSLEFIARTNQLWQQRHSKTVIDRRGAASAAEALLISPDPMDFRVQYLWGEKWFDRMGL